MLQNHTRALARPQHLFDLPAHTAWTLAGIGEVTLRLAHAVDGLARRRRDAAERPRAWLGPAHPPSHGEYGVTDAWRVR